MKIGEEFYKILCAVVPLYLTMVLAFLSVWWWKIFTPEQCAGINRFVATFAIPLLSFKFVASNSLYQINYRFIAADSLQKLFLLLLLFLLAKTPLLRRRNNKPNNPNSIDWVITVFSLATLPNTLVVGIPLLAAMYDDGFTSPLMVQIVVFQSVVWYTVLLVLFEYRAAVLFIADQFPAPGTAARISSVRVDPDVVSLTSSSCGRTVVGASIADVDERGNLHVVVSRLSSATSTSSTSLKQQAAGLMTGRDPVGGSGPPRASDLTGVEIWSVRSSSPRNSNFMEEDEINVGMKNVGSGRKSLHMPRPLHMFSWTGGGANNTAAAFPGYYYRNNYLNDIVGKRNKVWSSDVNSNVMEGGMESQTAVIQGETHDCDCIATVGADVAGATKADVEKDVEERGMAPTGVMARLVLIMVWKKLVRNPNSYASLVGVVWSLIAFRWNIPQPLIMKKSVSILSNTGLGMAMFSLGLFMALQPKIFACGTWMTLWAMAARFLLGPGLAAAAALAVGVRGVLLKVTIVQAALPQGIVPFVFAKEYNLHPDILSTAVIFGMALALPVTVGYYALLGALIS